METPHEPAQQFDAARLREWASGDVERLRHIAGLFCDTLTGSLGRLRQSREACDLSAARQAAHDLKNCFHLVDAEAAVALAQSVEALDSAETGATVSLLLMQLESRASTVLKAVRTGLSLD